MGDNKVVTNTKTSFDADTNPDLVPRSINKSGSIVTPVCTLDVGGAGTEAIMSETNRVPVKEGRPATSSLSNITASDSNQTALAANTASLGRKFFNDCDKVCYLKEGSTATSTSFTTKIDADGFYQTNYVGRIDVIWPSSATGALRVTELTA